MTRLTVGDCHARICNGRPSESIEKDCIITFEEARRCFADSDRTPASCAALFSAISTYAARVPMEDVYSEHLLMVLRRAAISTLHGAKADRGLRRPHGTRRGAPRFRLSPSHAVKSESEVRYEFARLLSELRAYPDGIELFDDVVGANEAPPLLRGYALHGRPSFFRTWVSSGMRWRRSRSTLRRLMDSEIRTADQAAGSHRSPTSAAKAEATALRRCHFRTLALADADVQAKIQGCFDAARQNFDTYHLQS